MAIMIKQALKEIFLESMEPGGLLHNRCDAILLSIVQQLPDNILNFIKRSVISCGSQYQQSS